MMFGNARPLFVSLTGLFEGLALESHLTEADTDWALYCPGSIREVLTWPSPFRTHGSRRQFLWSEASRAMTVEVQDRTLERLRRVIDRAESQERVLWPSPPPLQAGAAYVHSLHTLNCFLERRGHVPIVPLSEDFLAGINFANLNGLAIQHLVKRTMPGMEAYISPTGM